MGHLELNNFGQGRRSLFAPRLQRARRLIMPAASAVLRCAASTSSKVNIHRLWPICRSCVPAPRSAPPPSAAARARERHCPALAGTSPRQRCILGLTSNLPTSAPSRLWKPVLPAAVPAANLNSLVHPPQFSIQWILSLDQLPHCRFCHWRRIVR